MKTKLFILLLSVVALFSFSTEWEELKDKKAFQSKMKNQISSLKTLKAAFVQTKHLSFMEQDIVSNGSFAYNKSDKLLWEYTTPVHYKIVMNGSDLMIKDEAGKKVYNTKENAMFGEVSKMMSSGLSGEILQDQDFSSEVFFSNEAYKVVLTPEKEEVLKFLVSIELVINKESFIVEGLNMLEPGGDYTNIKFINAKYNSTLDESIFTLD